MFSCMRASISTVHVAWWQGWPPDRKRAFFHGPHRLAKGAWLRALHLQLICVIFTMHRAANDSFPIFVVLFRSTLTLLSTLHLAVAGRAATSARRTHHLAAVMMMTSKHDFCVLCAVTKLLPQAPHVHFCRVRATKYTPFSSSKASCAPDYAR